MSSGCRPVASFLLRPRSLVTFQGAAYTGYLHGIEEVGGRGGMGKWGPYVAERELAFPYRNFYVSGVAKGVLRAPVSLSAAVPQKAMWMCGVSQAQALFHIISNYLVQRWALYCYGTYGMLSDLTHA